MNIFSSCPFIFEVQLSKDAFAGGYVMPTASYGLIIACEVKIER